MDKKTQDTGNKKDCICNPVQGERIQIEAFLDLLDLLWIAAGDLKFVILSFIGASILQHSTGT